MAKNTLKNSIAVRLFIIGALAIILLIPTIMIQALIKERKQRRDETSLEVTDKWGSIQTITGPILTIPFQFTQQDDNEKFTKIKKYAHFLPDDLSIVCTIHPEIRYRGIYEFVLYNTKIQLTGNFPSLAFEDLNVSPNDVMWDDAFITVGITDMKGIKDIIKLNWNNTEFIASPGIESNDVCSSGISVKISLDAGIEKFDFHTEIDLNGSQSLMFVPVGRETKIEASSEWNNPSFTGNFLPELREISSDGFRAEWKVLQLNRNFPQKWIGNQHNIAPSTFGVSLLLPVDEYQKTMRTAKYAIMFIALTFLSFFMIELLGKKVIHPIQYLLIGFALLVFYTLLLSLSEYLSFKYSYLIASIGILLLITAYTKNVLSDKLQTVVIATVLVVLYGYLYIILQLQDYALLMGSLGLFVILSIVMYLTRKIDWFAILKIDDQLTSKSAQK